MVQKEYDFEPTWLLDLGALHHVTHDLANPSLTKDYTSDDQLMVANGKGLPITFSVPPT